MPAVTIVDLRRSFPVTEHERKSVAAEHAARLMQEWVDAQLPIPDMAYLFVHRPAELGRTQAQVTHRGDEAAAREEETGLVAVAVTMADVMEGAEGFLALEVRRTGP